MQHNLSEVKNTNELFPEKRAMRTSIVLQLFLTHGLAGATTLVLIPVLPHLGASPSLSLIGAIAISGGLGLLLTANILYTLHYVERALTDINQGHSATIPTFSWPLTQLFTRLSTLDRRVQMYVQGEQVAAEIRRNYLQQASESATRTERQRIARDLHDSIKQQLFSISVSAATAKAYWSKDLSQAQAAIYDIQHVVKEAQVEMQALLQQLGSTPLENTKLADALQTQAEALKYRSGLAIDITIGEFPSAELLPEGTQETIFRLVQEAFANIARHARATSVTLTLQPTEKALHLIISDNGQGFVVNTARAGMGLTNIRERVATLNGTIEIQSAPGQGTTLRIVVPFLQLQSSSEEKTWSAQELKQGMERAVNGFQLGSTAQSIALFFMVCNTSNFFIQIPIVALVICMLVAVYGLWQGHSWKTRLISYLGQENLDVLRLQQKEEKMLWYSLYVLLYSGFSFLNGYKGWGSLYSTAFSAALFVLFIVLLLLLFWRTYHTQGHIYRAIEPDDVQREITYQRRKVTRHVRLLVSLVVVALLFGGQFLSSRLSTSTAHWIIIILLPLFLIGCGIVLFDFMTLWQQQRSLGREQKKMSLGSLLRGE